MTADAAPTWRNVWAFALFLLTLYCLIWTVRIDAVFVQGYRSADGPRRADGYPIGVDFAQYPAVARAWETGTIGRVYDADYQRQLVREVTAEPDESPKAYNPRTLTFSYPPFYLWLPRLIAGLPYRTAFWVWLAIQMAFAALAVLAWRAELAGRPGTFRVVLLLFLIHPATTITLTLAQSPFLALAALSGTFLALNRGRDFLAGVCLSIVFYKPTFGLVLGPVMVLMGRWRLVGGVAVGGAALLAASLWAGTELLPAWVKALGELRRVAATTPDYFSKHFNWLAFVSNLLGRPTALTPAEFGPVANALWGVPVLAAVAAVVGAWWQPWRPGSPRFAACCAATVLATLFVSPYLFYYDVSIAALALVYTAKTLPLRPAWHAWAVLLGGAALTVMLSGGSELVKEMPLRLQLAPVGLALWLAAEVAAARTLPVAEKSALAENPVEFAESSSGGLLPGGR
jgi:hypothetical protein